MKTISEHAELLRKFNEWRRWRSDDDAPPMPKPKDIGEAIDAAVACMETAQRDSTPSILGLPGNMLNLRCEMILCPICGNKRCPHANDSANACTNSNEPGQPGSAYP